MLLGIPGDARAFTSWFSPAWPADLELRSDLDAIEALAPEREVLWTRLDKASFITLDANGTSRITYPRGGRPAR